MSASAAAIRAGQAYVELGADDSKLDRGLKAAEARLRAFGQSIAAVGAKLATIGVSAIGGVFALERLLSSSAESGAALFEMSERTGIAVEDLSAISYVAKQSGTSIQELEGNLRFMARFVYGVTKNAKELQPVLAELGINAQNLVQATPVQQLEIFADAFSRIEDPTLRAALAMKVFGRSGTNMLGLLSLGRQGIAALVQDAQKLGLVWSTEEAARADELSDRIATLWMSLSRLGSVIIGAVAPALQDFTSWLLPWVRAIGEFIRNNSWLVRLLLHVAFGATVAGAAVWTFGKIFSLAAFLVRGAAVATTIATTALKTLGVVATFIANPITLLIGGAAALGAGLGYFLATQTEIGRRALAFLGEKFRDIKDTVVTTWNGIRDAIAAGDWALAFRIGMLGIKAIWTQVIGWLQQGWIEFKGFFVDTFWRAVYAVARFWNNTVSFIESTWENMTSYLSILWTRFTGFLKTAWNRLGGFFAKVWARIKSWFTGEDASAEIARINQEVDAEEKRIQENINKAVEERKKQREARLQDIEDERRAHEDAMNRKQEAEQRARERAKEQRKQEINEEIRHTKNALKKAADQAAKARQRSMQQVQEKARPTQAFVPEIAEATVGPKSKVEVRGTFNVLAAEQFFAGRTDAEFNVQQKQLQELQNIKNHIKNIDEAARRNKLVFQ